MGQTTVAKNIKSLTTEWMCSVHIRRIIKSLGSLNNHRFILALLWNKGHQKLWLLLYFQIYPIVLTSQSLGLRSRYLFAVLVFGSSLWVVVILYNFCHLVQFPFICVSNGDLTNFVSTVYEHCVGTSQYCVTQCFRTIPKHHKHSKQSKDSRVPMT